MSRRIYIETPANCYQNQQSNIRFWAKMGLIVGLASRMCQANGIDKIPAVRETLGRLAALEATIAALVNGQIEACESWPEGYVTPNRRMVYATLNWCQEHHTEIIDTLRTLAARRRCRCRRASIWSRIPSSGPLRALVGHRHYAGARPAQALQAGVGPDRLPSSPAGTCCNEALLRRQLDHRAQPERNREAPWEDIPRHSRWLLERVEAPTA